MSVEKKAEQSRHWRRLRSVKTCAVALVFATLAAGCGGSDNNTTTTTPVTPAPSGLDPLSSMVAMWLDDAGNTGATSIPAYVKALVAAYDLDPTYPASMGYEFPLAATTDDTVRVISGLKSNVVAKWLDPIGSGTGAGAPRFGANCDYTAFFGDGWNSSWNGNQVGVPPQWSGSSTSGWVWVNHEYISNNQPTASSAPTGQHLTFAKWLKDQGVLTNDVESDTWDNASLTTYHAWYKRQLGGSWFRITKSGAEGEWEIDTSATGVRYDSSSNTLCRIVGYMQNGTDHDDAGTPLPAGVCAGIMGDCSGGTSPWGTIFTAEENVQGYYGDLEACWSSSNVFRLGNGYDAGGPVNPTYAASSTASYSLSPDANASHERDLYGFLAEIDPGIAPNDYYESIGNAGDGVGHRKVGTMGRVRWENCTFAVGTDWQLVPGQPVVIYGANDRRGGRIYKFVSANPYAAGMTKAQVRQLLDSGNLYCAHFASLDNETGFLRDDKLSLQDWNGLAPVRGQGTWIHMSTLNVSQDAPNAGASTANNPSVGALAPATTVGAALQNSTWNGIAGFPTDNDVLASLFTAAAKIGIKELNRPEDLEYSPFGYAGHGPLLYIAFTNHGRPNQLDEFGVLNTNITTGDQINTTTRPDGVGSIFAVKEGNQAMPGSSMTFEFWNVWLGSIGGGVFNAANPDNLMLDWAGCLYFGTDGNFGRNGHADALYYLDLDPGHNTTFRRPFRIAGGPGDSEFTGPSMTADGSSFFGQIQHPGETPGTSNWPPR